MMSSDQVKIRQLICDTDFLIRVTSAPIPEFARFVQQENFRIVTIPAVVRELRGLTRSKFPSTARKALNALRAVGKFVHIIDEVPDLKANEADLELHALAGLLHDGSIVATLDGKLLSRFERNHLPYFTFRSDKPFLKSPGRATYLSTRKVYLSKGF